MFHVTGPATTVSDRFGSIFTVLQNIDLSYLLRDCGSFES